MSGLLTLDIEYVELFTRGKRAMPKFSKSFPAQHVKTDLTWKDIVLNDDVRERLSEIKNWVDHSHEFLDEWNMKDKFRPGYLALFHGPPGTGKTFASKLIGKYTEKEVFRVDLSTVVSKYIGETEKNLSNLFNKAENKNWVLLFDEADALFGKRTEVKSSNDRFANQEVSFLLQRIETFSGLVILTSNLKSNLDDAFLRRFNTIIHFPFPKLEERELIWKKSFPVQVVVEENFLSNAAKYELAGGNIINVVQYACICALNKNSEVISWEDILKGIELETIKSGKVFRVLA